MKYRRKGNVKKDVISWERKREIERWGKEERKMLDILEPTTKQSHPE